MAARRQIVRLIRGEVDLVTGRGSMAGRAFVLTEGQRALMRHLVETPGTVTRDAIEALLGIARETRAIDLAIHRLRSKVEVDPRTPQLVISVFGEGYRFSPPPPAPRALIGLPPPRTTLFGREAALAELVSLLDDTDPVLLLGMSGVGKSSLALAAARATDHPRVVVADLEHLRDDELWTELARLTGSAAAAKDDEIASAVLADLRSRPRTLLLLDGAQRVADGVRALVARVAAEAPSTSVLVTSTIPIALPRVSLQPLGPIELDAARALFLARAKAVGATVTDDERLEALVERLDRLPLALELGAARTRTHTVQTLLERLDERFRWLVDPRAEVTRHQSLHAVLALSWSELSEEARSVLVRLSVFRGPISPEAAEAVLGEAARGLGALVDASWLVGDDDHVRWLESSRTWATEHADPSLLADAVQRHARHQLDLLERLMGPGPITPPAIDAIGAVLPDLWAVLEQTAAPDEAVAMADRLYTWVRVVGRFAALAAALDVLVERLTEPSHLAVLLRIRGSCRIQVDRDEEAWQDLERAEAIDLPDDRVHRLLMRAHLLMRARRVDEAREVWSEALRISPTSNVRAHAEHGLAIAARLIGEMEVAEEHLLRALEAEADLPSYRPNTRITYSVLLHHVGRTDDACAQLELATRELAPLRAERTLAPVVLNLGILEGERGRLDASLSWLVQAEDLWRRLGLEGRVAQAIITQAGMWIEAGDLDQAELMLERAAEMAPLLPDQRWSHALTSAALAAVRGSAADLAEARDLLAAIASDDRNPAATEIIRQLVDHGSGLDIPPVPPPNGSTAQGWARRILLSRTDATKGSQPR